MHFPHRCAFACEAAKRQVQIRSGVHLPLLRRWRAPPQPPQRKAAHPCLPPPVASCCLQLQQKSGLGQRNRHGQRSQAARRTPSRGEETREEAMRSYFIMQITDEKQEFLFFLLVTELTLKTAQPNSSGQETATGSNCQPVQQRKGAGVMGQQE